MKVSRHRGLRTIGWAAAFVLALHTMLFGLAATASLHAASNGSLTAEHCLGHSPDTNADTSADTDNDAAPRHSTRAHCASCFTVGGALPTLVGASPHPVTYAFAVALGAAVAMPLPRTAFHGRPGLPRAPPSHLA